MKKSDAGTPKKRASESLKAKHAGGCCFAADTMVMTPDYPRPIQTLVEGDRIVTYDPASGGLVEAVVEHVDVHVGRFPVREIQIGRNCVIRSMGNHFFFNGSEWVSCDELRMAVTAAGSLKSAWSFETNQVAHAVYDIQTSRGTCLVGDEAVLVGGSSKGSLKQNTAHAAHAASMHV